MSHTFPRIKTPPYLPETSPFSPNQRAWLNGFLAAWFQNTIHSEPDASLKQEEPSTSIPILYGSQTGNAKSLAFKTSKAFKKLGFETQVHDLASYDFNSIQEQSHLILLTSTYGEGDPPDNALSFSQWLHSESAIKLENLQYAIFGLGDSNYEHFCQTAIHFDSRLQSLGATPLVDLVTADVDYEDDFATWLEKIEKIPFSTSTELQSSDVQESLSLETVYDKNHPYCSTLLMNKILNGTGSEKEIRHYEFSLPSHELSFEVGDAIGVIPQNHPALVEKLISSAGLEQDSTMSSSNGSTTLLQDALSHQYEIRLPNKSGLQKLAKLAQSKSLDTLLLPDNSNQLFEFLKLNEWPDILTKFSPTFPTLGDFLSLFRKISPRLYSISNSLQAFPDSVHATIRSVQYTQNEKNRYGVCSNFLADLAPSSHVSVYIHSNENFRLPKDQSRPVIMIGPGTGIAPFRAFLQERETSQSTGGNWLFFGDQRKLCDFLYQDELISFQKNGTLKRLSLAFSRDQSEKSYVQHEMLKESKDLFQWIQDGASLYVCGDASRMAKDVHHTLLQILQSEGNLSLEKSEAFLSQLIAEKRYLRDVY